MSISVNRILCNADNRVVSATLAASAQRSSEDVRMVAQSRQGGGRLVVGGSYTGAADTVVDVEVVSGSGGALTPSAPVIRGVGNGVLSIDALAPSAVPETLSVALLDAGTAPVPAMLEFFGAALAARAPGVAGNALALSVTRDLATTPLQFATIESIAAGTDQFEGPQWDWGQPAATDAGIPDAAMRVQFDGFPTVHRAWKVWEAGKFVYRLDPAVPFEVPVDVRLLQVTGDYALSLTDGAATEAFTAVTIYDFLSQVEARSALAQVRGVVARDTAPGGMAVTEIPLRTDAHALPPTGGRVEVLGVLPTAPTELITLTYSGEGASTWAVSGGVSGVLPVATTGEIYARGPVKFRIPAPAVTGAGARISTVLSLVSREQGEGLPALCFKPLVLGAAASDKSVTFTYRIRPPADCVCEDLPALRLSGACLGLDVGGGGMALDAAYQSRLVLLHAWRANFVVANTGIDSPGTVADMIKSDAFDVVVAGQTVKALGDCLAEVYDNATALVQWDAYWTDIQALLAPYIDRSGQTAVFSDALSELPEGAWRDRLLAMMDHVRAVAGIVPKSDASSGASGDGCWRDDPDATHWWVDESGEYLPAFTNEPYVSVARSAEGVPVSTREFGFGIVTECEHRLKDGDKFTITIRGTGQAGYREGDKIVIPVVAAQAAPFVGGSNGDPTQTWTVRGTVSGALPDWAFNPAAPAQYVAGPVTASLTPGGIPFEVGDAIDVSIEGGTLRWRRDGGAWTVGDLFGAAHALGDGLNLTAVPGAAPSFVAGDLSRYRAVATYGTSRMRQPRIGQGFAWSGASVTIDVDLLAVHDVEAVLLGLHTLPAGCAVTISGGVAAVGEWTATPAWHASAVLAVLPVGTQARYLRVAVTGAGAGASIGWLWAGVGWQPTVGASDLTMRRQYGLARGQGLNPAALYRGRGTGGAWRWELDQGGALLGAAVDALLALVDHTAEQGMEPVCLVPDVRVPARAAIAVLDADEIVLTEHSNWQAEGVIEPMVSVELPFRAVLA